METAIDGGSHSPSNRDIYHSARSCEDLFLTYTDPRLPQSDLRTRAELQQQRFYVWASYLGVFAAYDASLDKRLEFSDEVRGLVLQLLSQIHINLEFSKRGARGWCYYSLDCWY